jgi:1-acyl-sn-glycerol-3-phosphate acyltransferase
MWGAATWLKLCGVKTVLRGTENVKPDETYVFISNHRSYLETAVVEAHLGRHVGIISKKELLKLPVAGRLMGYIDMLAIDRSNPTRAVETMRDAVQRIHNGLSVVVFAEGTRAMPGELLPFKKGAFHLAIEAGAKILPIAVHNSDKLMGKKTAYAEPGIITVDLLPPISTENLSAQTDLESLRDLVRTAIATALNQ